VKFGTADFAFCGDLDFGDTWGVKWENAFDTFAVRYFTDGESSIDAATAFCDYEACEDLDTLFAAFDNPAMDFYGVANAEGGNILFDLLLFDFLDDVHGRSWKVVVSWCGLRSSGDARGEMAS